MLPRAKKGLPVGFVHNYVFHLSPFPEAKDCTIRGIELKSSQQCKAECVYGDFLQLDFCFALYRSDQELMRIAPKQYDLVSCDHGISLVNYEYFPWKDAKCHVGSFSEEKLVPLAFLTNSGSTEFFFHEQTSPPYQCFTKYMRKILPVCESSESAEANIPPYRFSLGNKRTYYADHFE